jgi:diguanylate cyclase (GGDEF)-like protein
MNAFKSLVPILVLIIGAFYAYLRYEHLPVAILYGFAFIPVLLALLVTGLSFRFNRSRVFFYSLLIIIANAAPGFKWIEPGLSHALFSSLIPLQMLILVLLPERGILSARATPAYLSLLILIGAWVVMVKLTPAWATQGFMSHWLPPRYFDWTPLTQTVLAIDVTVFLYFLVLSFLRPTPQISAGLGTLIMLIAQTHAGDTSASLNVFSSAALLMCLYAVAQESWRMAYLDELTGLPGRRALREKFQQLSGAYTIAMLDVDHFKKFNDTYGHDTGDAVLQMIAGKMQKIGGGGLPFRYGGEEFSILFKGKACEDARAHLEKLRQTIADTPFVINRGSRRKGEGKGKAKSSKSVQVTVSIGMADSNTESSSPWDVLKLADKALYRAKNKGRNRVCG